MYKYKHRTDIHEHRSSKTKKPYKFVIKLSQRLDLSSSNKHVALQDLSVYYTWKIIRQHYKTIKSK